MTDRFILVLALVGTLVTAPVLAGCGGSCTGTVVGRTVGSKTILRIHRSLGSKESDFCPISGSNSRLSACLVGSVYPKCSK